MSEDKSKEIYVIKKEQVEQYYEFCDSYMEKTRWILKDYSDEHIMHDVKGFGYVCDIHAQCLAMIEILNNFFPLQSMKEGKAYKVDVKVAASLVKIYLTTLNMIKTLKLYGIYLENN